MKYVIKKICHTVEGESYEEFANNGKEYENSELATVAAYWLAEDEAESLNDGADEGVSFGVVSTKEGSVVNYYYQEDEDDDTGNTEVVTEYIAVEASFESKLATLSSLEYNAEIFARFIVYGILKENIEDADEAILIKLSGRIIDASCINDDPRFSCYDFAESIATWKESLDLKKLAELHLSDLWQVIVWMSQEKRSLYSDGIAGEGKPDFFESLIAKPEV